MNVSAIKGYLTLAEAAGVIGVSKSQVSRYISAGRIKAERLGLQVLIPEKEARQFQRRPRGNPNFSKQTA